MKFNSGEYYEVKGVDGFYGLAYKFKTIEEAVKNGKEMNEREIANGYKPTDWIVTRTTWSRSRDNDGSFISESSSTVKMSIDGYVDLERRAK